MKYLDTQWNGKPSFITLGYQFIERDGHLTFQAYFPEGVKGHPTARRGEFTPELWKWDVAEFFISGVDEKYIEFNLSPQGAWWAQGFRGKRNLDPQFTLEKFQITLSESGLSVSTRDLTTYLGEKENWRINVTAIMNSPDDLYLSEAILPGEEADFHQPASFSSYLDLITSTL